jgi:hypothetical protein
MNSFWNPKDHAKAATRFLLATEARPVPSVRQSSKSELREETIRANHKGARDDFSGGDRCVGC